jgi:predicted transposase/invertase (TIGR01784 family)
MNQAINAYREIVVSPEFHEIERLRDKARHDEAQALWNAERKGKRESMLEVAKSLLSLGASRDPVIQVTGLSRAEVERLYAVSKN